MIHVQLLCRTDYRLQTNDDSSAKYSINLQAKRQALSNKLKNTYINIIQLNTN